MPNELPPPSLRLLAFEARAMLEAARFILRPPNLERLPRGDGHAVMIVPGFGTNDQATAALRRALQRLGYSAHGWGCGTNTGMRSAIKLALAQRLDQMFERYEGKVSLIGWSLGGVFVREMARQQPDKVRRVITLGSPINGHPDANNIVRLFKLVGRADQVKTELGGFLKRCPAPPVPCTAIYTRSDGIVSWTCTQETAASNTENVEVHGSHLGLVHNTEVLRVIAERLAIVEDRQ